MSSIFGQTCSYNEASLVLLGVPWEVSVSYGEGAVEGPQWIQQASSQLDFFNPRTKQDVSKKGIHFWNLESLKKKNNEIRPLAVRILQNENFLKKTDKNNIQNFDSIKENHQKETSADITNKEDQLKQNKLSLQRVNKACEEMNAVVREKTQKILDDQKLFGLIGGDHSVSEGALLEIGKRCQGDFGLLHLDAHADMRPVYQGIKHSHASVMYNVLHQKYSPRSLVQIGIRDLCKEEFQQISSNSRVHCFFDHEIKKQLFEGKTWSNIVCSILEKLPPQIYISLDVDVLPWAYAPNTGCPVPGGFNFDHISYLIDQLAKTGKKILGFDVVEVSSPRLKAFGEWDGNVGARLVYKLCELSLNQA